MHLEPPTARGRTPTEIATALRDAAQRLGHRPAVTVLLPDGRQEQSVASLAQWAAKGAHLLELDLLLEPGDRLHLDVPASWPAAAVALACWWSGVVVTLDGDAEVAVVQAGRDAPPGAEVLRVGDRLDGGVDDAGAGAAPGAGEPWVRAVQAFPDQPPTPRAAGRLPALAAEGTLRTQAQLLAAVDADAQASTGPLGMEVPVEHRLDADGLVDLVLRPLATGRPTVVARGVPRDAADGDRVATWR